MQLSVLPEPNGSEKFAALVFRVAGPQLPASGGLRVEAGSGTIRCTLAGEPILWARPDPYCQGAWVLQRTAEGSPGILPHWNFPEARTHGEASSVKFMESWAKAIARALLESSRSPLHEGTFLLSAARRGLYGLEPVGTNHLPAIASGFEEFFGVDQPEWVPWGPMVRPVLPLRERPRNHEGRVKAWRKAVQEGWLPPLVLYWVSGLNAFLLLDGHARLVAMELEGVRPSQALMLWRPVDLPTGDAWRDDVARRYEHASERFSDWSEATTQQMNRWLVESFSKSYRIARNRAVPSNRRDIWQAEVAARLTELGKPGTHPMLSGKTPWET